MGLLWYPSGKLLTLDKNEKSRMFNDYYKNLVVKYFCGKNFFFLLLLAIV